DISMQIIYFLLYDMYDVFPIPVDLADVGHAGASRARVYILVALRGQFRQLCDPIVLYQQITTAIKATSATQPADYMTAGPLEIQLEASEVARIRSVPVRPNTLDLTYLLNEREVSAIHELDDTYRAKGLGEPTHSRNLCYFLGDNPRWSKTWSGVSGKIPTFRRLSALSFPVRSDMASAMGVNAVPILDPKRAAQMAGNSMALTCCAAVQMVALSSFALKTG
ncbi:unnamed protein product, partial [Polarella glacialis]